jgi:negative regulator of sigma E activity
MPGCRTSAGEPDMSYCIGLIGMWIFSDGLYSLALYLNAESYNGNKQTWRRDHWVRAVRMVFGVILIVMGGLG